MAKFELEKICVENYPLSLVDSRFDHNNCHPWMSPLYRSSPAYNAHFHYQYKIRYSSQFEDIDAVFSGGHIFYTG